MSKTEGFITDIQRFSLHDGPGIRTTVFMGGCNLRCAWCHNPETNLPGRQWQYLQSRCIGCGACVQACPQAALRQTPTGVARDAGACRLCGSCAEACWPGAICLVGRQEKAEGLLELLLRDAPFYEQGGGVTFSGGEPLLQAPFVAGVLAALRGQGIHTAVDTAGNVPWQSFEAVLPHTGLFLYDIKAVDPGVHARFTGVDNSLILENLKRLAAAGARLWVRLPLVHGVNDDEKNLEKTAGLLAGLAGVEQVDILPYHDYGRYKAGGLAFQVQAFTPPTAEALEYARRLLEARGLKTVIR
ncbi:glycyl-radical enzyme activating protein [Ruminococcaceae bacterium OttesenSCG-928-A11]|nr:glycyl-radical enzyme activating protein [Ruminococcaceae bacterium OttesenSCG-928-A11]